MASRPSSARTFLSNRVEELGPVLAGFFAVVVVVAGGSAVALLIWPSDSGSYFSWDLGAAPSAALIGGLYLASVVVFADTAVRPRAETRTSALGTLGLVLPTLLFTALRHEVFDWSRPQAVAWLILFASAPLVVLRDLRTPAGTDSSPTVSPGTRAVLAAASVGAAGSAIALWVPPTRVWLAARSPIPLAGLTADYLGAWCAFVAVSFATAAVRARTSDARSVGVLLGAASVGAIVAAVRTIPDLGANTTPYLAALGVMGISAIGLLGLSIHRQPSENTGPSRLIPMTKEQV